MEATAQLSVQVQEKSLAEQVAELRGEVEKLHRKHSEHVDTVDELKHWTREYRQSTSSRIGLPGAPAHLAIGSVTLLSPGSQPTVRLEGAAPSYKIHFGIPAAGEVRLVETNGKIHVVANDQKVAELAPVSKAQLAALINDKELLEPIVTEAVNQVRERLRKAWEEAYEQLDAEIKADEKAHSEKYEWSRSQAAQG